MLDLATRPSGQSSYHSSMHFTAQTYLYVESVLRIRIREPVFLLSSVPGSGILFLDPDFVCTVGLLLDFTKSIPL
jgi:hypothetical protein